MGNLPGINPQVMKVSDRHFLLTGGGNGIGRELALQMLSKGARITIVDKDAEALRETVRLAAQRSSSLEVCVADISDRKGVEALCRDILARGPVDGLINDAGVIQPFVSISELDYGMIERVMAVNFWGTVYMVKTLLPHLLTRPEAHIVNVSSMGGFLPVPGQTAYGASKAAVKLFTEGLHAELAHTQVRVTLVMPGAVATDITRNSGVDMPLAATTGKDAIPMLPVSNAATIILEAMEEDMYRVLVGRDAQTMDLLYRWNPARAARMIRKKMQGLLDTNPS
jgi:NAD(P)-dependent dehydrogenase (short-subunit alcohol dehydrogenase family)